MNKNPSRGAALMDSMQNLHIGNAMQSGKQRKVATGAADWEKQWDEDDGGFSDETTKTKNQVHCTSKTKPL